MQQAASASGFDRIRSNVQKMIDQKAPEADVDGYLKSEGLTPEQFRSLVLGGMTQRQHDLGGDLLRSGMAGVERGATGLLGIFSDLPETVYNADVAATNWIGKQLGRDYNLKSVDLPYGADWMTAQAEKLLGPIYTPETKAGKYLESAVEWGAPMLVGGAYSLPRVAGRVIPGMLGGISSELAGEATDNPYVKTGAGILATVLGGAKGALTSNAGKIAKRALTGTTAEERRAAEALQRTGQDVGVKLSAGQSMPALSGLASDVAASATGGANMRRFMATQAEQAKAAAQREITRVTGGPAMGSVSPRRAAVGLREGAKQAIADVTEARTAASAPYFERLKGDVTRGIENQHIQPTLTSRESDAIGRYMATGNIAHLAPLRPSPEVVGAINELRPAWNELQKQMGHANGSQLALLNELKRHMQSAGTDLSKLNDVRVEWRQRVDLPDLAPNSAKAASANVTPVLNRLQKAMERNSADFATGMAEYRRMSPPVDRLLESEVGDLAKGKGIANLLRNIVSPDRARPVDIAHVQSVLTSARPGAFRDAAKVYLETALSNAQKGRNLTPGARLVDQLAPTDLARDNLRAVIEGAARDAGLHPAGVWDGMNKLLDVLDRTDAIPGIGSRTAPRLATQAMSEESRVASALEGVNPLNIPRTTGKAIRGRVSDRTYRILSEALTSEDSLKAIKQLALKAGKKAEVFAWSIINGIMGIKRPEDHPVTIEPQSNIATEGAVKLDHSFGPKWLDIGNGMKIPLEAWMKAGKPDVTQLPPALQQLAVPQ